MKRLLLATDLCSNSDRAMERAVNLASEQDAQLYILHVIDKKHKEPDDLEERSVQIESFIKSYVDDHASVQGVRFSIDIIRSTKTYETICEHAQSLKVDLIVMGTHRKARFMDLFSATTSSKIIKNCHVPVLIVQEKPVAPYASVLCGYDFAPASRKALDFAVEIASGAQFDVVHAFEKPLVYPSVPYADTTEGSVLVGADIEKELLGVTHEYVQHHKKDMVGEPFNMSASVMKGDPYSALLERIKEKQPELLCVGAYGLDSVKIGPVANSFMSDPLCDILVVGLE